MLAALLLNMPRGFKTRRYRVWREDKDEDFHVISSEKTFVLRHVGSDVYETYASDDEDALLLILLSI